MAKKHKRQLGQPVTSSDDDLSVTAELNHKLMPLERGERYEDPLQQQLEKHGFGNTDGGGTMTSKSGEIEYIDIELRLSKPDESIPFVIKRLESYGAPKGSKLIFITGRQRREIPFGQSEGFGVYLDGVNLPDKVYKTCDVNLVIKEFNKLLKGHGSVQSYWQGPTETALYVYGDNAEKMKAKIAGFMATYPLCRGAKVITIAPKSPHSGR